MNLLTKRIASVASLVAMAVALEVICDAIPLFNMVWLQGGGISLAMLPIIILSYVYGIKYGIIGGIIFGLLNWLLSGKTYHWASPILDYIIPFGLIGVVGVFKTALKGNLVMFSMGFVFVFLERLFFHTISGMYCFSVPLWGSITYNAPYLFISTLFCFIVGLLIYKQIQSIFFAETNKKSLN